MTKRLPYVVVLNFVYYRILVVALCNLVLEKLLLLHIFLPLDKAALVSIIYNIYVFSL